MADKNLFTEGLLADLLEHGKKQVQDEVQRADRNYLLNVSETDYCDYLLSEYRLDPPVLHRDQIHVHEQRETKVDVSHDWGRAIYDRSQPTYITGTSVTIGVPFGGEGNLFKYQPNAFSTVFPRGTINGQLLLLTYQMTEHNPEQLKQRYQQDLGLIESYLRSVADQVRAYNDGLPGHIRALVSARRQKLLADAGLVSALGIPVRRAPSDSGTFAPPEIRRKPPVHRPEAAAGSFVPEPAMPDKEYEFILKTIESVVHVMERSPRAFAGMDEPSLRDHILVQLNGHYEGQATGETFNASGKTDILVRVADKNVFIAECKFWKGPKSLLEALDQLLGYASWRDTKTAVVIFNRDSEHSTVLQRIVETMPTHSCFKREIGRQGETQFRYLFHQPGDRNREVLLTVLAFDVPSRDRVATT